MQITIQQVHSYNDLVKQGKAPRLGNIDQLLIPQLTADDEVVFHDLSTGDIIHPGINMIEKILAYLKIYCNV